MIPRPVKTGRTMSYYDADCVERVRRIRRLQSERFLPLSAIRKILRSARSIEDELALGEAMMCISEASAHEKCLLREEMEKQTGYSTADLDRIEALGLIRPRETPQGKVYDPVDRQILSLIRQRREAGFPLDYSLEMMSIYRRHIQAIVREDAKLFARFLLPAASAREAARYIREGDRALGAFMPLIREKLAGANAEGIIGSMDGIPRRLREALRFRIVSEFLKNQKNQGDPGRMQGSAAPFWSCLARALGGRKPCDASFAPAEEGVAAVLWGLRALGRGRSDEARVCFERARPGKRLAPLCEALAGIAHLFRAPEAPGLLGGLEALKQALGWLRASRRYTADREVHLLTSYFRGIGLAAVPDLFDTHVEAAEDLTKVARSAGSNEEGLAGIFFTELGLKASCALAEMHSGDEAYEDAEKALAGVLRRGGGGFYHRWAARRIKEIARRKGARADWEDRRTLLPPAGTV